MSMTLAELEQAIVEIREDQKLLMEKIDSMLVVLPSKDYFKVSDLARKLGCSSGTLYTKPWMLPYYGRRTLPSGWTVEECRRWYAVPLPERKEEWDRLPQDERREIMNARAKRKEFLKAV